MITETITGEATLVDETTLVETTLEEMTRKRANAIRFFRKQRKQGISAWLEHSPFGGIVREGIVECYRASVESQGNVWRVHYNRPHTQSPVSPPPKGMMDFTPISAACLTGVLVLEVSGQVYPGPNFPHIPGEFTRA